MHRPLSAHSPPALHTSGWSDRWSALAPYSPEDPFLTHSAIVKEALKGSLLPSHYPFSLSFTCPYSWHLTQWPSTGQRPGKDSLCLQLLV